MKNLRKDLENILIDLEIKFNKVSIKKDIIYIEIVIHDLDFSFITKLKSKLNKLLDILSMETFFEDFNNTLTIKIIIK